ncbi:hypothetical protein ANCCEY_07579 [Ancylostoma ceylanicum]|uniref:Tc1-like transposase DDE domain-containing protein n=1 Tax=Ancylostoma ceylanicum TaxID=53326 RepID=A0A0D6LQ60_9BILA|nr:hypothetical protein ANCCEY_07579 [Ancylostoma ceylanicum]
MDLKAWEATGAVCGRTSPSSVAATSEDRVNVVDWPTYSTDQNPIENSWEILARKVYEDHRHFRTIDELKAAIVDACEDVESTS